MLTWKSALPSPNHRIRAQRRARRVLPGDRTRLVTGSSHGYASAMAENQKPPPLTAEQQAENIVKESGNTFQAKVATYFRSMQWNVMLSPYYLDNATDRARELDLVARDN
jgi:hypothetical protein